MSETRTVRGVTGPFVKYGERRDSPGWIVADNGCHIWTGTRNSYGYGVLRRGGHQRHMHRIRYEREVGPVPEGMQLDHFACNDRLCCNPAHVRPVTQRENLLRGDTVVAAAAARTHCPKGHPLSGDNLSRALLRVGKRRCATCIRERARARYRAVEK